MSDRPQPIRRSDPGGVFGAAYSGTVRTRRFAVTLARLSPATTLPRHAHEPATLNVVLDGPYSEAIEGSRFSFYGPATLILKPGGAMHENRVGSAAVECIVVETDSEIIPEVRVHRSARIARIAGGMRIELARPTDATPLVVEELAWELLAVATPSPPFRGEARRDRWLTRAQEILHEEPGPQSLSELAARVDRHPVYVARAFRARFGSTVGEYVRTLRLERARRLLHDRRLTLSQVAHRAGYCDQSHMTRDFRDGFRTSPATYRTLVR